MSNLEEIARALCRYHYRNVGLTDGQIEDAVGASWVFHVGAARAAVEAMREPVPSATRAASDWIEDNSGWCFGQSSMNDLWNVQITSILNEEP